MDLNETSWRNSTNQATGEYARRCAEKDAG